jgi:hypothetical protein
VCGTKNFASVRLYSAPQLHRTIVVILKNMRLRRARSSRIRLHNQTDPWPLGSPPVSPGFAGCDGAVSRLALSNASRVEWARREFWLYWLPPGGRERRSVPSGASTVRRVSSRVFRDAVAGRKCLLLEDPPEPSRPSATKQRLRFRTRQAKGPTAIALPWRTPLYLAQTQHTSKVVPSVLRANYVGEPRLRAEPALVARARPETFRIKNGAMMPNTRCN